MEGHFEFPDSGVRPVFLNVRKPGYFNEQELGRCRILPFPISSQTGPDSPPPVLKLIPEAIITGRVTGVDSEPLENVQVTLTALPVVEGRRRPQQMQSSSTDEDGEYRMGSLRPGSYLVSVTTGFRQIPDVDESPPQAVGYPLAWFYPGVPDRSSATPVQIAPGQNFRVDFSLRKQPVFRIAGTVLRPDGVAGVGVNLVGPDGSFVRGPSQFLADSGQFEFLQIPGGSYVVAATGNDGQGHSYSSQTPLQLSANLEGLRLILDASAIPVVVKTESTKPPDPAPVVPAAQFRPPLVQVHLEGEDQMNTQLWAGQEGTTEQPVQNIRGARPGSYLLRAQAMPPYYVASASCGDTDLLRQPLVIAAGAQTPPINLTLRDDAGKLTVTLDGSVPAIDAQLLIISESAPMQQPSLGFVGGQARMMSGGWGSRGSGSMWSVSPVPSQGLIKTEINGLMPGDYTVLAFDRLDDLEYANPEVLKPYLFQSAHVHVDSRGEATVSVKVIRREE
jgi:hypothetical protein